MHHGLRNTQVLGGQRGQNGIAHTAPLVLAKSVAKTIPRA